MEYYNKSSSWNRLAQILIILCFLQIIHVIRANAQWVNDSSNGFYPRRSQASCVVSGLIYVIGGGHFDTLQVFYPSTHIWSLPAISGTFISGELMAGTTASVLDGKIYDIESYYYFKYYDSLKVFDPATNSWAYPSVTGNFTPRTAFSSCVVNGKIYTIGGLTNIAGIDTVLNSLDVFDPTTNMWSTPVTNGSFIARYGASSGVIDGKIYVVGGSGHFDPSQDVPPVQVFDPSTNTWSTPVTKGTFTQRWYLTSAVVNGKIYAIGGAVYPFGVSSSFLHTVEIFDPATNTWTEGPSMPTGRDELSSAIVNGKIYAIGGYNGDNELNTVEVLDVGPASVRDVASSQIISLAPSYPNPITSTSTISFTLPAASQVTLTVTDAAGRVRQLWPAGRLDAGQHEVTWDASNYPSGVYLCRLEAGGVSAARRVLVMH